MVTIIVEGLKETRAYLAETDRRAKRIGKIIPRDGSTIIKRNVVQAIRNGQTYRGAFSREGSSGGLADNIIKRQSKNTRTKTVWIVTPNPELSGFQHPRGTGFIEPPAVYANFVEFGTGHSSAKRYFEKGIINARKEIDSLVKKGANKIIKHK